MDEAEAQFRYLVSDFGFERKAGLSDFKSPLPNLKSPDPVKLPGIFSLVERYSLADTRIEICYGDRELIVEGCWWYQPDSPPFGLWEMVNAANRTNSGLGGAAFVNTGDFMRSTISNMAESLKENMDIFIGPNNNLIDRALEIRGLALKFDLERQRGKDLKRAKLSAAEAFRDKEYGEVIALLSPFTDIFSDADKKMVEICMKRT